MNLPQPTEHAELFMQSENKINVCELPARASEQTSQIAFMVRSDRSRVLQTSSSLPQETRLWESGTTARAFYLVHKRPELQLRCKRISPPGAPRQVDIDLSNGNEDEIILRPLSPTSRQNRGGEGFTNCVSRIVLMNSKLKNTALYPSAKHLG